MEAHERSNDVFLKLAERGIITIYDEVDAEMRAHVRDRLAIACANGIEDLKIYTQTEGGNVMAGLDIHDMIRAAPVKTRTGLVLGYGHSMGVIILQACERREAMRHARLLIHYVTLQEKMSLMAFRNSKRLEKLLTTGESCQGNIEAILARRTKRKLSEIRKACIKDIEMSSEEALAFGLIDAIRD